MSEQGSNQERTRRKRIYRGNTVTRGFIACCVVVLSISANAAEYVVTPKPGVNSTAIFDAVDGNEVGRLTGRETLPWSRSIPWYYEVKRSDTAVGYIRKGYAKRLESTSPSSDDMRVHFLHTGAGSCALVECPSSQEVMMIDCGSWAGDVDTNFHRTESEMEFRVKELLGANATGRPMNVVLSHGDFDHYSHMNTVLCDFTVSNLFLGGFSTYYSSSGFPAWKSAMIADGTTVHEDLPIDFHTDPSSPEPALSCGAAHTYILTNRAKRNTTPKKSHRNANGMVVMIEYEDFRVIFSGDATGVTEREVMSNYPDISATVVTASHHGATGKIHQRLFHSPQGSHVQIVGRFVQQQQVATAFQ